MEILKQAMRIYNQHMRMELATEKCVMLIMKSGKRQMTEEIERRNQENIRTLEEKETYKYLGILEVDTIKHAEIKEKNEKKKTLENEKPNYIVEISSES